MLELKANAFGSSNQMPYMSNSMHSCYTCILSEVVGMLPVSWYIWGTGTRGPAACCALPARGGQARVLQAATAAGIFFSCQGLCSAYAPPIITFGDSTCLSDFLNLLTMFWRNDASYAMC